MKLSPIEDKHPMVATAMFDASKATFRGNQPTSKEGLIDPSERNLKVSLEDKDLWNQFNKLTNEMIVTKSGRLDML